MWLILVPFAVGLLAGMLLPGRLARAAGPAVTGGLALLLFTMGARVGADPRVVARLGALGAQAIVIAALSIVLSVALVRAVVRLPEGPA